MTVGTSHSYGVRLPTVYVLQLVSEWVGVYSASHHLHIR
jgi:hypothetical protein